MSHAAPHLNSVSFAALVHDLRQPLSTIETCAYLLRTILENDGDERVLENLDCIERQVAEAHRMLLEAGLGGDQTSASRPLTKSASSGDA
jgi:signal transduction histidine kinase